MVDLGYYDLSSSDVYVLYREYLSALVAIDEELFHRFQFRLIQTQESVYRKGARWATDIKRRIKGSYNIVHLQTFLSSGQAS